MECLTDLSDSDLDMCDDRSTQESSDVLTFDEQFQELETLGYGASSIVKKCLKPAKSSCGSSQISEEAPQTYAVKIVFSSDQAI